MSETIADVRTSRIAIVILNWNGYKNTKRCLEGLASLDKDYQVYIVDNASNDGSGERLQSEFPWCRVIFNDENLGFAGGCNVGIQQALQDGMQHIVLLNNDTIIEQDFVAPLVKTAEKNDDTAIIGGVIEHANSNDVWYAGGEMQPLLVKANRVTTPATGDPFETDHVVGALMLITREFIKEEGMLDEEYFFGIEDTDISLRARKSGWNVLVNPNAKIKHDVSSTAGSGSAFKHYHAARNRLYFASQHLSNPERFVFYVFFLSTRLVRAVQWFPRQVHKIRATFDGVIDHLLGRPHKKPEDFGLGSGEKQKN